MAAVVMLASCTNSGEKPQLATQQDTLSWAMGENIALSMKEMQGIGLDNERILEAIRHTLDGGVQPLSDAEVQTALEYIIMCQQRQMMQQANQNKASMDKQQAEYFERLKKEHPGIKQHPSGFYYEELKAGKGPTAQYAQVIRFDYRSYFMLTGEPYDQTYGVRRPITHVVGKPMFIGLVDGVQLMNAGSIYRFYFPYELVFGESGKDGIPGYTPMIYEVELHEIVTHK